MAGRIGRLGKNNKIISEPIFRSFFSFVFVFTKSLLSRFSGFRKNVGRLTCNIVEYSNNNIEGGH